MISLALSFSEGSSKDALKELLVKDLDRDNQYYLLLSAWQRSKIIQTKIKYSRMAAKNIEKAKNDLDVIQSKTDTEDGSTEETDESELERWETNKKSLQTSVDCTSEVGAGNVSLEKSITDICIKKNETSQKAISDPEKTGEHLGGSVAFYQIDSESQSPTESESDTSSENSIKRGSNIPPQAFTKKGSKLEIVPTVNENIKQPSLEHSDKTDTLKADLSKEALSENVETAAVILPVKMIAMPVGHNDAIAASNLQQPDQALSISIITSEEPKVEETGSNFQQPKLQVLIPLVQPQELKEEISTQTEKELVQAPSILFTGQEEPNEEIVGLNYQQTETQPSIALFQPEKQEEPKEEIAGPNLQQPELQPFIPLVQPQDHKIFSQDAKKHDQEPSILPTEPEVHKDPIAGPNLQQPELQPSIPVAQPGELKDEVSTQNVKKADQELLILITGKQEPEDDLVVPKFEHSKLHPSIPILNFEEKNDEIPKQNLQLPKTEPSNPMEEPLEELIRPNLQQSELQLCIPTVQPEEPMEKNAGPAFQKPEQQSSSQIVIPEELKKEAAAQNLNNPTQELPDPIINQDEPEYEGSLQELKQSIQELPNPILMLEGRNEELSVPSLRKSDQKLLVSSDDEVSTKAPVLEVRAIVSEEMKLENEGLLTHNLLSEIDQQPIKLQACIEEKSILNQVQILEKAAAVSDPSEDSADAKIEVIETVVPELKCIVGNNSKSDTDSDLELEHVQGIEQPIAVTIVHEENDGLHRNPEEDHGPDSSEDVRPQKNESMVPEKPSLEAQIEIELAHWDLNDKSTKEEKPQPVTTEELEPSVFPELRNDERLLHEEQAKRAQHQERIEKIIESIEVFDEYPNEIEATQELADLQFEQANVNETGDLLVLSGFTSYRAGYWTSVTAARLDNEWTSLMRESSLSKYSKARFVQWKPIKNECFTPTKMNDPNAVYHILGHDDRKLTLFPGVRLALSEMAEGCCPSTCNGTMLWNKMKTKLTMQADAGISKQQDALNSFMQWIQGKAVIDYFEKAQIGEDANQKASVIVHTPLLSVDESENCTDISVYYQTIYKQVFMVVATRAAAPSTIYLSVGKEIVNRKLMIAAAFEAYLDFATKLNGADVVFVSE